MILQFLEREMTDIKCWREIADDDIKGREREMMISRGE